MNLKKYIKAFPVALILAVLAGCKPTEANYRAAYLAAKEKTEAESPVEATIYERIRKEAVNSGLIYGNDTIPMMTMPVKCTPGLSDPSMVNRYSVAVARFKQIFNARSMAERLRVQGHENATVVENGEPLYYVIASTYASADSAVVGFGKLVSDDNVKCRPPYPCILKAAIYPLAE